MHARTDIIGADDGVAAYHLVSYRFGQPGAGKAYIQASLHADEVPAMLVAHHLRQSLERLESEGRVKGEVILVPAANPIGLSQVVHGTPFGRFDLASGVNFNRAFRHLADRLKTELEGRLGSDAAANVALVREHARRALEDWQPASATETLKKTLLAMAIDADVVLDLHCDNEAVLHLYTGTPLADTVAPLAALLQAQAFLTTTVSGGEPFDEACSRLWWELAAHFGETAPLPPACVAVTVELRGENDVTHALARRDADALLQYLGRLGILDVEAAPAPAPLCAPTPLEAVAPLAAPQSGVLVFHKDLGERVRAGEIVAELVNPVSGVVAPVRAEGDGVLFARTAHRHLLRGMHICKIAGDRAFRRGSLLSD